MRPSARGAYAQCGSAHEDDAHQFEEKYFASRPANLRERAPAKSPTLLTSTSSRPKRSETVSELLGADSVRDVRFDGDASLRQPAIGQTRLCRGFYSNDSRCDRAHHLGASFNAMRGRYRAFLQ